MKSLPLINTLFILSFLLLTVTLSSAQGFLHRNGKYIYDGNGQEVILRGIGTGNWMLQEGYMMQSSDVAPTQWQFRQRLTQLIGEEKTEEFYNKWLEDHFRRVDVDSLKAWGFNSVRVAMHYKWFTPPIEDEPVPGEITWIEKGFVMIDALLSWCSDNEMYLILDLHGAPGGQGKDAAISDYNPAKPSLWESQANKDKTIALWRKLAERYSDEPWIGGYDLINETNWTFPEGNNSQLRKLMGDITAAIREVDKNHIIFIEGNGFANDFSGMTPPWDQNMVYSFHKYWNYNTQESINFAINLRNQHNIPIWLGESGENSNVWFTNLIDLLERNKIGWAMWPVKKSGINNPLRVVVNNDYTQLINFWKGTAANPGAEAAFNAVMKFSDNHRFENNIIQRDVIDAMIRQPHTRETIPFRLFTTGEPIFAADYNLGRNGYAYFDRDTANYRLNTNVFVNWNQGWSYRNDGVDIQACSDTQTNGFNIGWTNDGEWMEYTLEVEQEAAYTLSIRHASGSGGSRVRLEINGIPATGVLPLPGTSGWQTWQSATFQGVILPEGAHKIKFIFEQGGSNLNWFMFSNPTPVASEPFTITYAQTSTDGKTILLTLNKPITSEEFAAGDFNLTINNNPIPVTSLAVNFDQPRLLVLTVEEALFFGGVIRLSYSGSGIESKDQKLELFSNLTVKNNLPVRFNVPSRIQAEDFALNNGMVSESTTDTGGGMNMGYANPGDYLDYRVYIPKAGWYKIDFRIATQRSFSELTVQAGGEGNPFTSVGTLAIAATGGWQTWKTMPLVVNLPEGRYTLRLFIKSGEFNINWFDITLNPTTGVDLQSAPAIKVYPNPASGKVTIDLSALDHGSKTLELFNITGQKVKNIATSGSEKIAIDISDLEKGFYMIRVRSNNSILSTSRLIIN
jgi:endoglucanase